VEDTLSTALTDVFDATRTLSQLRVLLYKYRTRTTKVNSSVYHAPLCIFEFLRYLLTRTIKTTMTKRQNAETKPTDTAASVEEEHVERAVLSVFSCTPALTYDCALHSADCCRSSRAPSAQCSDHAVRSPLPERCTQCNIITRRGNTSYCLANK